MPDIVFRECECPSFGPAPHPIAQNVGFVFYCAQCDGFISLRNDTIEGLIRSLTKLLDGDHVNFGPPPPHLERYKPRP